MREKERLKIRGRAGWMVTIALLMIGVSCKKTQAPLDIPQLVKIAEVQQYGGKSSVNYPGKIKAAENVKLAFRVAGPIKKVYVLSLIHI